MTTPEEWRPVVGEEGRYEVSNLGRVRSLAHWTRNGVAEYLAKERLLKPAINSNGYPMVDFRKRGNGTRRGGGGRNRTLHSLVMESFVGPRPPELEVLHRNGDKTDARLSNLRYGTGAENARDALRHGQNPFASRTHCPQGHEYTPENTYIHKRGNGSTFRQCKTCARDRARAQRNAHIGRSGAREGTAGYLI